MSGPFLFKKFLAASGCPSPPGDAHLGHGVHRHVDKVVGGDGLLGLDVHGHLAKVQLIQPLQKGDADACLADEDTAVFPQAGDDVGLVRRGLYIAQKQDDDDDQDGMRNGR